MDYALWLQEQMRHWALLGMLWMPLLLLPFAGSLGRRRARR